MRRPLIPLLVVLLAACGGSAPGTRTPLTATVAGSFQEVDAALPDDPALEALVAPFRVRLDERLSEVLAQAEDRIVKARPEGALGALAADAMLAAARRRTDHPIDAALLNDGGLRAPIPRGPVTLASIYEVFPFENTLVLLQLTGVQMEALADQIAARGGHPVAGLTFRMEGREPDAIQVQVDGAAVEPGRTYWLVTADFVANGGDGFTTLEDPIAREDLGVLVRDAITEHVRELGTLRATPPGRIRMAGP